jgi:GMP synthase-like glutamine amidotransferase
MKIYSAIYQDYAHLDNLYPQAKLAVITNPADFDEPGILIIHGGADISPAIYNQTPIRQTQATAELSSRDQTEIALMKAAIEKGILIYGICRGAQLATCLAGGSLIQHVTNHQNNHTIYTVTQKYEANSCHHQMMDIRNTEHDLIAWTPSGFSSCYTIDSGEIELDYEPEIVWFPKIKALTVQGHPEWLPRHSKFVNLCNSLVEKYYV